MAVHLGKHSGNDLAHGAKMPTASTNQTKSASPSTGNTKTNAKSNDPAPKSTVVKQDFSSKPMSMKPAVKGRTS